MAMTAAERPSWLVYERRAPCSGRFAVTTLTFPGTGALFAMEHNGWDHALKVTADGAGLIGHAGAVLLRKAADQAGLTAGLSAALRRKGASPLLDRGVVLVLMAAIALGATSMSDIAVLSHLALVLGDRAERPDGAAGAGPGRPAGRAGPDRPRPRQGPGACVDADRGHRGRRGRDPRSPHRHGSPAPPRTAPSRTTRTPRRSPA